MAGKDDVRILVVDDEQYMREIVRQALEGAEYRVDEADDGARALDMIRQQPYDVIITDLRMPGMPGERILEQALESSPETIVIIMTGYGNIQTAVSAIRMGAYDFIPKPFQLDEMVLRVSKGLEGRQLRSENALLRSELQQKYHVSSLIGDSPAMRRLNAMVGLVAQKNSTVLITGETGTGKELVARALHYSSSRNNHALVAVHCGAIPSNLLEDELFGHVKGAFTGANQHRIGRFEQANHGTLFLDEVGTMAADLQVKLLRVLQEREFQKVGGATTVKVDVRIIAAANTDLEEKVKKGDFREDLYYRLNVIPIQIVPLRQRREDVQQLVAHFVRKYCDEQRTTPKRVSPQAMRQLIAFEWPGNVRQLENAVEMAVALSGSRELLDVGDFPTIASAADGGEALPPVEIPAGGIDFNRAVEELERRLIVQSLEKAGGNRKRAAELLQLKRTTLVEKLKRMGIEERGEAAG